jgi:alkylhydroperoxidase family enzyme
MAGALADVEWDACVLEPRRDRDLEAYVRRGFGTVPSSVAYFTAAPWIVHSMTELSPFGSPLLHVDSVLADLVGLVVSQDNSCRYCFGIQRLMLRVHGLPESRYKQLEQGYLDAEIDPHAKSALDFARRLSRAAPLSAATDTAALRAAGWSTEGIRELAFHAVYNVYMNRLMTIAAIPYAPVEGLADSWVTRLASPMIRVMMHRRERRALAHAQYLPPERARGPFSYLVGALDGLPSARVLRETLDAAFASTLLPKRAKSLVFAVIARGLDDAAAARESSDLLAEAGLAPERAESVLTHLGSSELDAVENALVPFARGTIRGRPMQIQQRTRTLRESLSREQLVEAIGVAALANAVTRLSVVTEV